MYLLKHTNWIINNMRTFGTATEPYNRLPAERRQKAPALGVCGWACQAFFQPQKSSGSSVIKFILFEELANQIEEVKRFVIKNYETSIFGDQRSMLTRMSQQYVCVRWWMYPATWRRKGEDCRLHHPLCLTLWSSIYPGSPQVSGGICNFCMFLEFFRLPQPQNKKNKNNLTPEHQDKHGPPVLVKIVNIKEIGNYLRNLSLKYEDFFGYVTYWTIHIFTAHKHCICSLIYYCRMKQRWN